MANYSTDFTEYTTGVIPSDWTARWDATTQFTVETGGTDKILKGVIAANNRHICTWNDVDADANRANVESLTKFRTLSVVGGAAGGVARASGTGTTETGYAAYIQDDDLRVTKYVSGTSTSVVTQALTLLANTDYWLRFRVNGTALQARIWLTTESEPVTWNIDTTDTSISAAGWSGVFAFSLDSDPEFDAIAIATNGDTASFGTSTSTVSSDLGDSYALRADTASDLGDSYALRAAVSGDLGDSYLLRSGVSADLGDSYLLRDTADSDLADAYIIDSAAAVGNDLADSYAIRALASGDLADSYAIRSSVSADLPDGYHLTTSVGNDFADSYLLRTGVSTDLSDNYSLLGYINGDYIDSYEVSGLVSSDLSDSYAFVTLNQTDLDSIAAAVWAHPSAVAAHAKLDDILNCCNG